MGDNGGLLTRPCTAGNIHANHQAGLLFIDFETGATLQISGEEPCIRLMTCYSSLTHDINDTVGAFVASTQVSD